MAEKPKNPRPIKWISEVASDGSIINKPSYEIYTFKPPPSEIIEARVKSSLSSDTATSSSFAVSASYATTASYALTALSASYAPGGGGGDTFPYTGSAIISGSLNVIGEFTGSGLNYPTIDGDEKQLLSTNSSGTLTFDWADRTNIDVKNTSGVTLELGTPIYITGYNGASLYEVQAASSSLSSTMPSIGVLSQQLAPNAQGYATLVGAMRGFDTTLYTVNEVLYVGEGVLTPTKPTGEVLLQSMARVSKPGVSNGVITILGAGRSNAVPNLLENQIFYGSGSNQAYQIHISGALDSTVINNITSSGVISSSFIGDGSGLTGIISSSYASTASYVNPLVQAVIITGSLIVTGSASGGGDINTTNAVLYDDAGNVSIAYTTRGLNATSGPKSIDWQNRLLYDAGNVQSIDYANRLLKDRTGATIANYFNADAFFSGSLHGTASYADIASFAQSGNGIFSGSFSGSFEGLGTNLTDVPVTVTNTLWVSPAGNDSTAIKGNLQRSWASISASLATAVSGDSVIMEPGTYIEPPFTLPVGVTLKSLGGLKSTTISASNNSATFITQEENSRLEGFTLVCPSGSFPGIFYDSEGDASIYDVTLKGQGNSIGFQISQSTSTTSKVIYNEIRYGGGDFDKLVYVKGGIFACDGIHIPGGGNIDKIYHVEAGRLQATNTNAGNPNVSSSFYIEGGDNIILGCNLFNLQTAFHIANEPYHIHVMSPYIDDNVARHIHVEANVSGSGEPHSEFHIVSGHIEDAKITHANLDWVNSNHAFSFQDDGVDLTPAYRFQSDLEVGHANKGFTFGAGEGLPYNKGMQVWASGSGGLSQSLSAEATSKSDSTFVFTYSGSNDAMYIGNSQKSPDISDLYLFVTGLQYKQVHTGSYTPGDLSLEIFTTASTWEPIDGAQAISHVEGYNYANNVFSHNNSHEHIIANVNTNVWATSSLFGTEARWGRIRIVNPLTTSPEFEQFVFTPNATLINPKGQLSFRGKALSRQTVPIVGNTWGDDGLANPTLANIGGDNTWDHKIMNTRMNNTGDTAYNQLAIPAGVCTAYPMNIQISFRSTQAETAKVEIALVQQTGVKVNDPAGGKIPTSRTTANTTDFNNAAVPITTFSFAVPDTNNTIEVFELSPVDISSFYEGDLILIRVLNTTANGNLDIVDTNLTFVKWALGERENGIKNP